MRWCTGPATPRALAQVLALLCILSAAPLPAGSAPATNANLEDVDRVNLAKQERGALDRPNGRGSPEGLQPVSSDSPPEDDEGWLRWYEERYNLLDTGLAWSYTRTPSQAEIDAAVRAYRAANPRTPEQSVRALMDAVSGSCVEGGVCRDHAALFLLAGRRLGLDVEFRAYLPGIIPTNKWHCWNAISVGGRRYVIDAYNNIQYGE